MPDSVTRMAWNPKPAIHLDAGGVLRVFGHTVAPYDRNFTSTGGGVSLNARVNPAPRTRVIGVLGALLFFAQVRYSLP